MIADLSLVTVHIATSKPLDRSCDLFTFPCFQKRHCLFRGGNWHASWLPKALNGRVLGYLCVTVGIVVSLWQLVRHYVCDSWNHSICVTSGIVVSLWQLVLWYSVWLVILWYLCVTVAVVSVCDSGSCGISVWQLILWHVLVMVAIFVSVCDSYYCSILCLSWYGGIVVWQLVLWYVCDS